MNEKDKIDILLKIYENQQSLISNADNKANISLSVQLFLITTVFGTSIIVNTYGLLNNLSCFIVVLFYILFTTFLLSSIIGLTLCILVFTPRPPQEQSELERLGISYFGHIVRFESSKEYLKAINGLDQDGLKKEFGSQNYSLAHILRHKMKYVKASTVFLFINILLGVSLFVLSIATR